MGEMDGAGRVRLGREGALGGNEVRERRSSADATRHTTGRKGEREKGC